MGSFLTSLFAKPIATVAFNMQPRRGSWGGGNQWVAQTARYMEASGYRVQYDLRGEVDCIVTTHAGTSGPLCFSFEEVGDYKRRHPNARCIQRINDNDIRKGTDKMDRILSEANAVADHTVFVSQWLRDYHAGRWFDFDRPYSVILNGADPRYFHPIGNTPWKMGEPCRIVTHHWSDNWSKGFKVYQQIDELIASGALQGCELWVIGRWPKEIAWKTARTFGATQGEALGNLLRQCHLYVSASLWEPGANHPVEGIQCGLPLLYHADTGGTVELGQRYGIEFRDNLITALNSAKARYEELRRAILQDPPSGDAMCIEYRKLIQQQIANSLCS